MKQEGQRQLETTTEEPVNLSREAFPEVSGSKPGTEEKQRVRQTVVLWNVTQGSRGRRNRQLLDLVLRENFPGMKGLSWLVNHVTIKADQILKNHNISKGLSARKFLLLYNSWCHGVSVVKLPRGMSFSDESLQAAFKDYEKFVGLKQRLSEATGKSIVFGGEIDFQALADLHPDSPAKQKWRDHYFDMIRANFSREELTQGIILSMSGPDFSKEVDGLLRLDIPPENIVCVENDPELRATFEAQVAARGVQGYFGDVLRVVEKIPPIMIGLFDYYGGFCPNHWMTLGKLRLREKALIGYNFLEGREHGFSQALLGTASASAETTGSLLLGQEVADLIRDRNGGNSAYADALVRDAVLRTCLNGYRGASRPVSQSRQPAIDRLICYILGAFNSDNPYVDLICEKGNAEERLLEYGKAITGIRMIMLDLAKPFSSQYPQMRGAIDRLIFETLGAGIEISRAEPYRYQAKRANLYYQSSFLLLHNNASIYQRWRNIAHPLIEFGAACLKKGRGFSVSVAGRNSDGMGGPPQLTRNDRIILRSGDRELSLKVKKLTQMAQSIRQHRQNYISPSQFPKHRLIT